MRFMVRKSIKSICAMFTSCYKPHVGKRNRFSKLSAQSSCPDLQKVEQGNTCVNSNNGQINENKRSGRKHFCCPPEFFKRLKLKIRRRK